MEIRQRTRDCAFMKKSGENKKIWMVGDWEGSTDLMYFYDKKYKGLDNVIVYYRYAGDWHTASYDYLHFKKFINRGDWIIITEEEAALI